MLTYGGVVTGVPSQNDPNLTDKFHKVYSASLSIAATVDFFTLPQQACASPRPVPVHP